MTTPNMRSNKDRYNTTTTLSGYGVANVMLSLNMQTPCVMLTVAVLTNVGIK